MRILTKIKGSLGGILFLALLAASFIFSCAKKPNDQELQRLEEARKSAEAAEAQFEAIRKERIALEEELAKKQKELEKIEQEVEKAKTNSGN